MAYDAPLEEVFFTVVSTIALTTLLTGLLFVCLGSFRLGGLARYLPYPVVGGFLAGTGWLLFKGGFFLIDRDIVFPVLFEPANIVHWFPGLLLALLMFILSKRIQSTLVLPSLILGGVLSFYAIAWLMGHRAADLSLHGWLLGPFDGHALWRPLSFAQIQMADWNVILGQAANITTVLIVCSLSILLNASGLELAVKRDVDLNRELQTSGYGNLLSGLIPGFVGFLQISLTTLNYKINARSRIVGLVSITIIGLTIAFGASIISYIPKFIMGAVLMYLGITFLYEWVFETWVSLPKIDIFIIWMILIVIAVFGFLPGIVLGFMAAIIMFAISCSRAQVIRHELTGRSCRSQVTRSLNQRLVLDREGDKVYILKLQGFIFFGTVNHLFKKIRNRLNDDSKPIPEFVLLDFRRVENLDSTGMLSFKRLKNFTSDSNVHIIITTPTMKIKRQLEQGGLPSSVEFTHYFPDLDSGLEWCEDMILKSECGLLIDAPSPLKKQLHSMFPEISNLSRLFDYLERKEVVQGETIIKQGEKSDDLFFIESGRLTTNFERANGTPIRLESMRSSRVVGEIGFYLGKERTASVVADEKSVVYRINYRHLKELEQKDPEAANILHRVVVYLMAERFTSLIETVNALQK